MKWNNISWNNLAQDSEKIVIETERIVIEYIDKTFVDDIFSEKNNEQVNKYLANRTAKTKEELINRLDITIEKNWKYDSFQFQVSKKWVQEFLALCAIKKADTLYPEIWLWIKESAWWKWYWKEIVGALIKQIQNNMNYEHIIYETFEDNISSIKIIESLWWILQEGWEMKDNYYGEKLKHIQYRIYNDKK